MKKAVALGLSFILCIGLVGCGGVKYNSFRDTETGATVSLLSTKEEIATVLGEGEVADSPSDFESPVEIVLYDGEDVQMNFRDGVATSLYTRLDHFEIHNYKPGMSQEDVAKIFAVSEISDPPYDIAVYHNYYDKNGKETDEENVVYKATVAFKNGEFSSLSISVNYTKI